MDKNKKKTLKLVLEQFTDFPKYLQKFIVGLNTSLEKLKSNNTVYYINLALTNDTYSLSNSATACIDMLTSNGYFLVISLLTRNNDHSASINDHIVTNNHLHSVSPGILKRDSIDHYLIFCIFLIFQSRKLYNLHTNEIFQNLIRMIFLNTCIFCSFCSLFQDENKINAENFDVIFSSFLCIINRAINLLAFLEKLSRS